jgi:TRAP-type uncharacterized transport system substrate-binding protein
LAKTPMNARMMRAKMALEVAAELYTRNMSSMGNVVRIAIEPSAKEERFAPLVLGINGDLLGGMRAPLEVAAGRVDVAFVNPSAIVTMAYRGKGFFNKRLPLRALAVFPSWDRIAFAVAKSLKLKSLREAFDNKIPLRISTRSSGVGNTTHYTISRILACYGVSFASFKRWGGTVEELPRPSMPQRLRGVQRGTVNAVFDEGINTWLSAALDCDFELLPLDSAVIRQMEALGYRQAVIPRARFPRLAADVRTIDFSGWPLITHDHLGGTVAYSICQSIEARQAVIPVDDEAPLDVKGLCGGSESAPIGIPLHRGAKRFFRERGYL